MNETVEYMMMASHRSAKDTVDVNITYHDDSAQNTTETITINPYMVSEVPMSINSNNMTRNRKVRRSASVRADHRFDLRVFVTRGNYTEGFLPLRKSILGTNHYVSTFCEFGGYCQFSITAIKQTGVYLKLPESVTDIVFCIGEATFHASTETNFTLEPNESLLVESPQDLSGTHIVTNRKVVVVAGARDMDVNGTMSHLVEQLVPVSRWGNNFIVTSMNINQYGDIIQITSSRYHTRVEMSGFPFFELPRPGMTVKRRLEAGMTSTITSNYPIQVLQLSGLWYTTSANVIADSSVTIAPGMAVVIATEHFDNKYHITCGINRASASVKMFSNSTVDIYRQADSTICLDDSVVVPYSSYSVFSASAFATERVTRIKAVNDEPFGGTFRCDETGVMMPLGILVEDVGYNFYIRERERVWRNCWMAMMSWDTSGRCREHLQYIWSFEIRGNILRNQKILFV